VRQLVKAPKYEQQIVQLALHANLTTLGVMGSSYLRMQGKTSWESDVPHEPFHVIRDLARNETFFVVLFQV